MEKRFTASKQGTAPQVRKIEGRLYFTGYGAVFYDGTPETEFHLDEDLFERINPHAFDRALRERHDCRGLFNHDSNFIFGRTGAGTLRLIVDKRGLRYESPCDLRNPIHAHVAGAMESGNVSGSSFQFMLTDVSYYREKGILYREILDVDLYDVGPVTFPAYKGASSSLTGIPSNRFETPAAQSSGMSAVDVQLLTDRKRILLQQKADLVKL